jgi:F-type H+-transporting ATPase subunit delta
MNDGLISKRYAKALLDFSAARGDDKALYDRMKLLSDNLAALPSLRETLKNPIVSYDDKLKLLYSAAGQNVEESYKRFVQLVLANRRENALHNIALSYIAFYRRIHRIGKVSIASAMPLDDTLAEKIRWAVERRIHGTVEFDRRVDANLSGGFIFQVEDFRLDASVAGLLEKMRKQLVLK